MSEFQDNNAGCTIAGVTVQPIPNEPLNEEAYVMLAVEHYNKAIQYDILASQLRDARTESKSDSPLLRYCGDLLRYCGDQPGDDWVKRVERLNGIIDGLNGRGRVCECKQAIVGTVVV